MKTPKIPKTGQCRHRILLWERGKKYADRMGLGEITKWHLAYQAYLAGFKAGRTARVQGEVQMRAARVDGKHCVSAPPLSEAQIQKSCEDWLKLDDWRIFRLELNFSERKRKATGEKGAPDCMAVRYCCPDYVTRTEMNNPQRAYTNTLFIEWKRLKGKAFFAQKLWQATEQSRGALCWIAGEDFEATIEDFKRHYRASGLMRKNLR